MAFILGQQELYCFTFRHLLRRRETTHIFYVFNWHWALSLCVINGQKWRNRITDDLEVGKEEIGDKNHLKNSMKKESNNSFDNDPFFDYNCCKQDDI